MADNAPVPASTQHFSKPLEALMSFTPSNHTSRNNIIASPVSGSVWTFRLMLGLSGHFKVLERMWKY